MLKLEQIREEWQGVAKWDPDQSSPVLFKKRAPIKVPVQAYMQSDVK